MNEVIPRGYDLSVPQETQAFIDDFRCQRAENILKDIYARVTGLERPGEDLLVTEGKCWAPTGNVIDFFPDFLSSRVNRS